MNTTRYIDRICAEEHYELEGSARRTTGLTSDSCGFLLGPDPGRIVVTIPAEDHTPFDSYEVSALVRTTANDATSWRPLEAAAEGGPGVFALDSTGEEIEVVDVRIHAWKDDFGDCGL